ncbi:hypothetical protein B0X71_06070 [Planococcus lenghuensis]|uniref:Uncharacterized protein n=1 Tax=Planococcus lenghuensis TaxID=2213202 RepID=A0A1Q2KY39_9BACL|nr:hypothetical protein B0X71_06070 [Planococcus lenghuensis]
MIHKNLKKIRKGKGETQLQLAKKLKISGNCQFNSSDYIWLIMVWKMAKQKMIKSNWALLLWLWK